MLNVNVISADGYILNLNNEKYFKLIDVDGLNPTKTNIYSTDIYTVDGSTFNYAKDESRNIVIQLYFNEDKQKAKNEILKAFSNRKKITLEFDNLYTIDGYVESIDYNFFEKNVICQISVICLYPYFKSKETVKYTLSNIVNLLEFPFTVPYVGTPFGELANTTNIVYNNSNIESGIIIDGFFTGYANNLIIRNNTNGSYLTINKTFNYGDVLNIDTFSTIKKFVLNDESITNYVITGNRFLYLNVGANNISAEASFGNNNFVLEVLTKTVYTGI